MFYCIVRDAVNCGRADASFWDINNTFDADIIHAIFNGTQIGKQILDFPALIEVDSTHNAVRNVMENQFFLENTGLRICAVENGKVFVGGKSGRDNICNGIRNTAGFFIFIFKLRVIDCISLWLLCPECLVLSDGIIFNHSVCGVQNILGGTVIFFQFNDFCLRILAFKIQDIINIGTAEFIDRLVIIADNAEIM